MSDRRRLRLLRPKVEHRLADGRIVVACPPCKGSGVVSFESPLELAYGEMYTTRRMPCKHCNGRGLLTLDPDLEWVQCAACEGTGYFWAGDIMEYVECSTCSGRGLMSLVETQASETGTTQRVARLSPEQQEEAEDHGYKSQLPIEITGRLDSRGRNIVVAGKIEVPLGDRLFIPFLRLAAELFHNKEGIVHLSDLINSDYVSAEGPDQLFQRLRDAFKPALEGVDPKDFIQVVRPKTRRLSTHPALIRYDKKALLEHPNAGIRKLAEELPD